MLRFGTWLVGKVVCTFSNEKFNDLGKNRMSRVLTSEALGALVVTVSLYGGDVCAKKPLVSDTGYEILYSPQARSLYWVGNRQLLLAGIKTADMQKAIAAKEQNHVERLRKLYLWDDATKSIRLYAEAQSVCIANGVIHYQVRVDRTAGKQFVREGPFGSEKEIEKTLPSKEELSWQEKNKRVWSDFTCKIHLRNELSPPAPQGRRIVVLREADGYLDAGPQGTIERVREIRANGPGNVKLFRPGSSMGINLPITLQQGIGAPIYSELLRAYVTLPGPKGANPGHITEWPRGLPFTVYVFKSTGETSEVAIPYGDLMNISWVQPTRAGWILGGGNFYKSLGLYLFDGKATSMLDSGAVREIAVTPDGCIAAVGIQNKHLDMGTPVNLRIFDFCVRGR